MAYKSVSRYLAKSSHCKAVNSSACSVLFQQDKRGNYWVDNPDTWSTVKEKISASKVESHICQMLFTFSVQVLSQNTGSVPSVQIPIHMQGRGICFIYLLFWVGGVFWVRGYDLPLLPSPFPYFLYSLFRSWQSSILWPLKLRIPHLFSYVSFRGELNFNWSFNHASIST